MSESLEGFDVDDEDSEHHSNYGGTTDENESQSDLESEDTEDETTNKDANEQDSLPAPCTRTSGSDGEGEVCPICLNHFVGQELGMPENCNHTFCLDCIQEWSTNLNSCPLDRIEFNEILVKSVAFGDVLKKIKVKMRAREAEAALPEDTTVCEVCQLGDREDHLLLCDSCDLAYHCECLNPPLRSIPIVEWFCPPCCAILNRTNGRRANAAGAHRIIPRTIVSETVRSRIQSQRTNNIDSSASSRTLVSRPSTSRTSATPTPKRRRKYRKRRRTITKTTVLARTKGNAGLGKGKTASRVVVTTTVRRKRRRRRIKRRPKAASVQTTRSRLASRPLAAPSAQGRIAKNLGICKPLPGHTMPSVKQSSSKTREGGSSSSGLCLFGNHNQLMDFDEDCSSNACIAGPSNSSSKTVVAAPAQPCVDLLGNIFMAQEILQKPSKDITIGWDGSLTLKKPASATTKSTILQNNSVSSSEKKSDSSSQASPSLFSSKNEPSSSSSIINQRARTDARKRAAISKAVTVKSEKLFHCARSVKTEDEGVCIKSESGINNRTSSSVSNNVKLEVITASPERVVVDQKAIKIEPGNIKREKEIPDMNSRTIVKEESMSCDNKPFIESQQQENIEEGTRNVTSSTDIVRNLSSESNHYGRITHSGEIKSELPARSISRTHVKSENRDIKVEVKTESLITDDQAYVSGSEREAGLLNNSTGSSHERLARKNNLHMPFVNIKMEDSKPIIKKEGNKRAYDTVSEATSSKIADGRLTIKSESEEENIDRNKVAIRDYINTVYRDDVPLNYNTVSDEIDTKFLCSNSKSFRQNEIKDENTTSGVLNVSCNCISSDGLTVTASNFPIKSDQSSSSNSDEYDLPRKRRKQRLNECYSENRTLPDRFSRPDRSSQDMCNDGHGTRKEDRPIRGLDNEFPQEEYCDRDNANNLNFNTEYTPLEDSSNAEEAYCSWDLENLNDITVNALTSSSSGMCSTASNSDYNGSSNSNAVSADDDMIQDLTLSESKRKKLADSSVHDGKALKRKAADDSDFEIVAVKVKKSVFVKPARSTCVGQMEVEIIDEVKHVMESPSEHNQIADMTDNDLTSASNNSIIENNQCRPTEFKLQKECKILKQENGDFNSENSSENPYIANNESISNLIQDQYIATGDFSEGVPVVISNQIKSDSEKHDNVKNRHYFHYSYIKNELKKEEVSVVKKEKCSSQMKAPIFKLKSEVAKAIELKKELDPSNPVCCSDSVKTKNPSPDSSTFTTSEIACHLAVQQEKDTQDPEIDGNNLASLTENNELISAPRYKHNLKQHREFSPEKYDRTTHKQKKKEHKVSKKLQPQLSDKHKDPEGPSCSNAKKHDSEQKQNLFLCVESIVKKILKPFFLDKSLTKDNYKDIMKRSIPKILKNSSSGVIDTNKIRKLILKYVELFKKQPKTS